MNDTMTSKERLLLESFLRCSDNYLEFGCGASTVIASDLVGTSVTAIDASQAWIDEVAKTCAVQSTKIVPRLLHVDIGPLGDWSYPKDRSKMDQWPAYYERIWEESDTAKCDLFLIDGRFRVACFMKTLLNCRDDSVIMIHDFSDRRQYHIIKEFAKEVATQNNLSAFIVNKENSQDEINDVLSKFRLNCE